MNPPAARWSIPRVAVAGALVLAGAAAGTRAVRARLRDTPPPAATWYAPYVDVTLTPRYAFEDPAVAGGDDLVLAFVVADPDAGCTPTWGAAYDLDEAATGLDLDRRIARHRQGGGDVVVSFGGAAHEELAVACSDEDDLVDAYRAVVDRYDVTTVDLDVEGEALADTASLRRRSRALARLQASRPGLSVWLTLPATPAGLTSTGVRAVDDALAAGVDLGGVNMMTMSFGPSRSPGTAMADAVEDAVEAGRQQVDAAHRAVGIVLDPADLWGKVGATPMIGVNDSVTDRFTLADARRLRDLARERGLGRVSTWSANRDGPCPRPTVEVSDRCSGVAQAPGAFGRTFDPLPGRARDAAGRHPPSATSAPVRPDDPATSPYPVWRRAAAYEEGDEVVHHGRVYTALWWTRGDGPGGEHQPSPWRLVGPVLPTDRPPATVSAGTYPAWDRAVAYREGARVLVAGVAYEARWWARGVDPTGPGDGAAPNPWVRLDPPR